MRGSPSTGVFTSVINVVLKLKGWPGLSFQGADVGRGQAPVLEPRGHRSSCAGHIWRLAEGDCDRFQRERRGLREVLSGESLWPYCLTRIFTLKVCLKLKISLKSGANEAEPQGPGGLLCVCLRRECSWYKIAEGRWRSACLSWNRNNWNWGWTLQLNSATGRL